MPEPAADLSGRRTRAWSTTVDANVKNLIDGKHDTGWSSDARKSRRSPCFGRRRAASSGQLIHAAPPSSCPGSGSRRRPTGIVGGAPLASAPGVWGVSRRRTATSRSPRSTGRRRRSGEAGGRPEVDREGLHGPGGNNAYRRRGRLPSHGHGASPRQSASTSAPTTRSDVAQRVGRLARNVSGPSASTTRTSWSSIWRGRQPDPPQVLELRHVEGPQVLPQGRGPAMDLARDAPTRWRRRPKERRQR